MAKHTDAVKGHKGKDKAKDAGSAKGRDRRPGKKSAQAPADPKSKEVADVAAPTAGASGAAAPTTVTERSTLTEKQYQALLKPLHAELVALQEWVRSSGAKVCVVFEGRDTAGKGGVIKAITERVSPRVFRVVALPAPSDRERTQMYVQRYLPHFPAAGEVVIFDRSWYNRAGVEQVMGFSPPAEVERFLELAPAVEKAMVHSGIILLKYWLEVGPEEQTRRLQGRINDPRKVWKLSPMDLESYTRWDEYTRARDNMFTATSTSWAPWFLAVTEDKKRGRLNVISHLLGHIPYQPLAPRDVTLPERTATATPPPADSFHQVPEKY